MAITVTNLVGGPATISKGATDLGSTIGGIKLEINEDLNPIEVDQSSMPLGYLQSKMNAKITGTLAESSLTNLSYVLGSTNGAGRNSAPSSSTFTIVGPGAAGKTRTITIHKGIFCANTSIEYKRGEQQGIPFEILLIADTTKTDEQGQLFSIADAT